MSNPVIQDVHFNQMLTNFSVAYVADNSNYASAQNAFPTVRSPHKSDSYWRFDRADMLRLAMKPRAVGAEAAEAGFDVDPNSTYNCKNWALRKFIPDDTRRNADPSIDLDKLAVNFLTGQMLQAQEVDFFTKFVKASVWGIDMTVGTQWNVAGSTPIKTTRANILAAQKQTGWKVDTIIMGEAVWSPLQDNADFLSRVSFGTPAALGQQPNPSIVTPQLLATLLGVKRVIVSGAVQCTSEKGQTNVYDFISGKDAILVFAPPVVGPQEATAGVKFVWTGRDNAGADGQILRRYRNEDRKGEFIEIECAWTNEIVCPELGIYIPNAVQ